MANVRPPTYPNPFPTARADLRSTLMAVVETVAAVTATHRDASEEARTLEPAVVGALRESGLTRMKSPRAAGGAEAHPADQMDVIEALTMIDPAAAWSMFITSAVTGGALSWLPDEAVQEVLSAGPFPLMAGSLRPAGSATPVDGGYRVSGRWAWGSGVHHADYVAVPVLMADGSGVVRVVVPIAEVTVHDTWLVLGMKGTGSTDYSMDQVFVPNRFASRTAAPVRGGALYRLGYGFVVNEHGSFAYALGRLALKTVVDLAAEKKRGYAGATSIADRAVFQRAVGEGELRLSAARLLMIDVLERLFDSAAEGEAPAALQAEARAAATLCTDEAIAVTTNLFRYAGGSSVLQASPLQRILRDLMTVQSHLVVSDSAYEILGQLRLGLTDSAPLR